MSLTSHDETDLILPLFQGMAEHPRFATFCERLKRRTDAVHVGIVLRSVDAPSGRETVFHAGLDIHGLLRKALASEREAARVDPFTRLRPGRVYSPDEIRDLDPQAMAARQQSLERLGVRDERVLRVANGDETDILLTIARARPCGAADSVLLSNLAPYVAAAMRNFIAVESRRVEAAMAAQGLRRSGVGWILFGSDAKVLAIDPATRDGLCELAGVGIVPGERLRIADTWTQREIAAAASELAGNPLAEQRAVVLCDEPRIEAILQCANAVEVAGMSLPAMLALCRLPKPASRGRAERLAALFELPAREAELAVAIADGLSIAEAADAMGLTIETARNYSKLLYAKLGLRGQAELVRLVYESGAVLA